MSQRAPQNMGDPSSTDVAAEIASAAAGAQEAPDMTGGHDPDERGDLGDAFDVKPVPPDCPVQPLGFLAQKFYFLDFAGQLIALGSEFRKGELMALFGTRMGFLDGFWPQWKKIETKKGAPPEFEKDGFSQKDAQQGLIMACSKRGLFDPTGKVRGRGAHKGDHGELVLHCGDAVLVGGRKGVKGRVKDAASFKPGLVGAYVYPTLPALPRPADEAASKDVAGLILAALETWNWKRKEIAAHLLLCWIGAALLGGALRIRPHGWIVGPSGAGKTTLQAFLRELMGDWGVFTEDATEAGVRQLLNQDTLAVMFDEIEAEADNQDVVMRIVRLARLAYSGASSLRGSSDHQAKQFTARSCFLFSSIHHHELPAQDRNRIAILQLSKFAKDAAGLGPEQFLIPQEAKRWGDLLRRRLIEQWPRFEATLAVYQTEMHRQGYSGREQDTYGTLLACGDLLLYDTGPEMLAAAGRAYEKVRDLTAIVDVARSEAEDTSERCVKHLASHRLPARGAEPQDTVARWLQKLLVKIHNEDTAEHVKAVRDRLGAHGLRVVHLAADHLDGNGQGGLVDAYLTLNSKRDVQPMWLAVANKTNKGMQEIFAGSHWPGGVWTQALSLIPGAFVNKKSRFAGGSPENCVLVPLDQVCDVAGAIEEAETLKSAPELPIAPEA
jgi:hypothetical protein